MSRRRDAAMTTKQIEAWARESGVCIGAGLRFTSGGDDIDVSTEALTRFAEMVAHHERERCAKVCEAQDDAMHDSAQECNGYDCAAAIRALKD